MNNKIKKGDIVQIMYKENNDAQTEVLGVIVSKNSNELIVGHNFSGAVLIDKTKIAPENILSINKIRYSKFKK